MRPEMQVVTVDVEVVASGLAIQDGQDADGYCVV
jgi:hypothetical protein